LNVVDMFGATRDADLAMHPTVKPVALIADAILDASQPKGAVLDCFAGSGSTTVAAAKTGRVGYGIEFDPIYCDVILNRLARFLKADPVLQQTGKTFTETATEPAMRPPNGLKSTQILMRPPRFS
jgi:DNA modification methylase